MYDYSLTRSKRKTISLSISTDLTVIVKAPLHMSQAAVDNFVGNHTNWIEKNILITKAQNIHALSEVDKTQLKADAKQFLPKQVLHYANIMGVKATGVKITSALTRWGSCSPKNCLSFSYRIMLLPTTLIDYIIVHELAHINVKNHSSDFYKEIEKYQPDYKSRIANLRLLEKTLPR